MLQPDPLKVFAHRFNPNGTTDSIWSFCFATVGSVLAEQELGAEEATSSVGSVRSPPIRRVPILWPE